MPLLGVGALASLVVPRRTRSWVFGSGIGVGEGALALERAAREAGYETTWIARTDREREAARALGIRTAHGLGAFVATLRAGVVVFTHGFGDVSRSAVSGAYVVNLWHGIPLKRLHRDAPGFLRLPWLPNLPVVEALLRRAHRVSAARISLFPVASERVACRIRSAFGIDRAVRVLGDPRVDRLVDGTRETRVARARALLASHGIDGERLVLYAPTWRDGAGDPAVPTEAEWRAVTAWLAEADAQLLIRSHPLGVGDYAAGVSDRVRLVGHDTIADVTDILPAIDTLVTDYSSIAFDAGLQGTPTVFLAPDVQAYTSMRGLYDRYEQFAPEYAVDWAGVLQRLDELTVLEHRAVAEQRARKLASDVVQISGGAARRVLHAVEADLGLRDPEPVSLSAEVRITHVSLTEAGLVIRGTTVGMPLISARLHGHSTIEGRVRVDGAAFVATIPLRFDNGLVLPSGTWQVELATDAGRVSSLVSAALPPPALHFDARMTLEHREASVAVVIEPGLSDAERGRGNQRRLERAHFQAPQPQRAVFFESFYGSRASCNPLGIDRALARLHPDVTRYWSVRDASVAVPAGAIAVIEGSQAWWRARAGARLLVVNDWLRKRHRRMPHQRVLQTWHGTPLKRLALDRERVGIRTRIATLLESRRWNVMLAQNAHSANVFRSAYAFRGPILQQGYPRSDALFHADVEGIRRSIGVLPGSRVVLYAPTWRDDRVDVVDHIGLARLRASLGSDVALLVRGHSRSQVSQNVPAGVIDVSDYADTADILAIADVLVTDYSSVMFDFAATGRPIVFAVPDFDDYRDRLRGFTFDLLADTPGPLVRGTADLDAAIREALEGAEVWSAARERWRARFTPNDDGAAGTRVVRYLERYL